MNNFIIYACAFVWCNGCFYHVESLTCQYFLKTGGSNFTCLIIICWIKYLLSSQFISTILEKVARQFWWSMYHCILYEKHVGKLHAQRGNFHDSGPKVNRVIVRLDISMQFFSQVLINSVVICSYVFFFFSLQFWLCNLFLVLFPLLF